MQLARISSVVALPLGGLALGALLFSGCARRPVIVQSPPATVINQSSPPAASTPATVNVNTSPAPMQPTGRDVIVLREAPPPPRAEPPPPPPPSTEYRWVPGYWTARDGRQEWVAGRWEMPPRTEAVWVQPRWERRSDGYVFVEGYWR